MEEILAEIKKRVHSKHIFIALSVAIPLLLILNLMRTKYASYFLGILAPLLLESILLYIALSRAATKQKAVLDYEFGNFPTILSLSYLPNSHKSIKSLVRIETSS